MGCIAAKVNITIYEGGTFDQLYTWKTGTTPTAVNLTGHTAEFKLSAKITDLVPLFSCIKGVAPWAAGGASGVYIDNPTLGQFRIYLDEDDVSGLCLSDTNGVYDLFLYNAAGESVLKMYGKATIKAAIAR